MLLEHTDTPYCQISLPPHFIAQRLACRSEDGFQLAPSEHHGGKLGSVGDMLRGLLREQQAGCLKRRARMCRSCFCEQMFCTLGLFTDGPDSQDLFYGLLRPDIRGSKERTLDGSYGQFMKPKWTKLARLPRVF